MMKCASFPELSSSFCQSLLCLLLVRTVAMETPTSVGLWKRRDEPVTDLPFTALPPNVTREGCAEAAGVAVVSRPRVRLKSLRSIGSDPAMRPMPHSIIDHVMTCAMLSGAQHISPSLTEGDFEMSSSYIDSH